MLLMINAMLMPMSGAAGVDVSKVVVKANNNQERNVTVDESNQSTVESVNPVADLCNMMLLSLNMPKTSICQRPVFAKGKIG